MSGSGDVQWRQLMTLVWSEYAYCTMYGIDVVDGNIVGCSEIRRNLVFGPAAADAAEPPTFDEYWQALRTMCGRIHNGRLAELRFNRGRPVAARTSEGGRRFKRLVKERKPGSGTSAP